MELWSFWGANTFVMPDAETASGDVWVTDGCVQSLGERDMKWSLESVCQDFFTWGSDASRGL